MLLWAACRAAFASWPKSSVGNRAATNIANFAGWHRAVFAGGTWKGLQSPSGDVPVDLVLTAAQDAAAAAPRDRDRLLALVSAGSQ